MDATGRRLLLLLCCVSPGWTGASALTAPGQLYPPTNITFGMNGLSCLFWRWTPANSTANCSLCYKTEIVPDPKHSPPGGKSTALYYSVIFNSRIDFNKDITLNIYSECENKTSEVKTFTSPLAAGDPRTMVRNMTCVWHYNEYANCTWQPGEIAPPNVNYSLRYWLIADAHCPPVKDNLPTPFQNLLDQGEPCRNYTYRGGIPVGCVFKLDQVLGAFEDFVAVVTDRSQDIKPYIYFICIKSIAKLKAPAVIETKRTPKNSVFISWNGLTSLPVEYQVQLSTSNGKDKEHKLVQAESIEIPNALPHVTYTFKVRMKLVQYSLCFSHSPENHFLWSDWSEERILEAEHDKKIAFILLALLVSLVVIVATIILLINMRRLLLLLCPRIPDPSKVLPSDFQWLNERSVCNDPKKEEVCVVSLLETQSSSQVE